MQIGTPLYELERDQSTVDVLENDFTKSVTFGIKSGTVDSLQIPDCIVRN